MMIIMHEGATEQEIAHVVARIEEVGASAHVSVGERVDGDRRHRRPRGADRTPPRGVSGGRPGGGHSQAVQAREPRVPPHDTVIDVRGKKIGGSHFALIAGPCSIETEDQVMAAARAVKAAGGSMMRGGAFKPRSSPYAFQGLGLDGLKMMAAARDETGLPIVTELLGPA